MNSMMRLVTNLVLFSLFMTGQGLGLDQHELVFLKQAGIEDETLRVIMREKVIETAAFTVDEIVELKKAGLSGDTIRLIVKERSFLRDREPVVYGTDVRPVRLVTVEDIIKLKEAGIGDDVIQAIIYVIQNHGGQDQQKAWKMLRDMEIRIDMR